MAEWITVIATTITACAVLVVWKQIKADHERSRRERSVELVLEWAKSLNPKASISRKFAETLSKEDTISLYKQESFSVAEKYKTLLVGCLEAGEQEFTVESEKIKLTANQVVKIRWEVVSYLNKLEAILSAWRHNIADKDIIEEQFKYLISLEDGHELLPEFISVAGNGYPSIKEFAEHLKSTLTDKKGKKKVA